MEGSWRMRTETPTPILPNYPPRRSTDFTTTISDDDVLSTEDFADVFGGAPRTILSYQFSTACFFYENIFRQPETAAPPGGRRGRNLPEFRIPSGKQSGGDRYQQNVRNDTFGSEGERVVRSRSRSKASSSSALSSEELSPLRPAKFPGGDDVSLFASKLRPINVKSRWGSTKTGNKEQQRHQKMTISENHEFLENLKNYRLLSRRNEFAESANVDWVFPDDDLQFNSPASVVSSLSEMETCDEIHVQRPDVAKEEEEEEEEEEKDDDDDASLMRSYVIEINPGYKETKCDDESNGVDEAIAWMKEKFQKQSSETKTTQDHHHSEGTTKSSPSVLDERRDELPTAEETSKLEMQFLDEKIRMWSTGKEADIRLLLSYMHHILWPHSGWMAISATNLIGGSQVKKAYQKAVLCLHPDKLQQRGATLTQKYIAEKAFSVLQDAWAAFNTLDVFYG